MGKYVDRQYLDNTSNKARSLDAYYVQDMRFSYQWSSRISSTIKVFVQANNLFSKKYEANGYTFSYRYGGETSTENYYFPMAPFNMMAGLSISLK
jgi:iron complex outermembrane receptor protein